jgi:predicted nucleotidyltransferase
MRDMRPSELVASQRERILAFATRRGAGNIRVFGSVARGEDREGSDLDLLVDVPPGTSLFEIVDLELAIRDLLGIEVDLCLEDELDPRLKPRILAEARPI